MAKATVEVLIDDLDGSEGAETVRLGWNGDWRELELSKKNLAALSKALDKYWQVGRAVSANGQSSRRRSNTPTPTRPVPPRPRGERIARATRKKCEEAHQCRFHGIPHSVAWANGKPPRRSS